METEDRLVATHILREVAGSNGIITDNDYHIYFFKEETKAKYVCIVCS